MKTPFTLEQFLDVFRNYNESVWPLQILFFMLGVCSVFLVFFRIKADNKTISSILALLWIWTGIVYHILFFTSINKAAYAFGTLFIFQGILFLITGVIKSRLSFRFTNDLFSNSGLIFILYALIIYPILGYYSGHRYPSSPTFGLPCPTVIFTFGILLLSSKKVPLIYVVIPLIWSLIGFLAALKFGIFEDTGLLIVGLLGTALVIKKNRNFVTKLNATPGRPLTGVVTPEAMESTGKV